MMFFSRVENLDSYQRAINKLISFLIAISLCISLIAMWFIYSGFEKKSKILNNELIINANSILQSNVSEKLSILVNDQDFVSYLNKGEYSRKLNAVDMMVLFKKFIDNHFILGVEVNNRTGNSILTIGDTNSAFHISMDLCYLNGQINNQFGNCYHKIILFMSRNAYLDHLAKINGNIQPCTENHDRCDGFHPFSSNKFGSFAAESASKEFISIKYASQNTYQFFIPATIIFIISTLGLLMIHRVIKILTDRHLARPIKELETNLKNNMPLKHEYIQEINYLAKEIEEYQQHKVEIELGKNLAQVAHDIRSPLLAIDSFFCLVEKKLEETERVFGRRAIRRLDDIVWSLLYKYKNKNENVDRSGDNYVFLHSCIQELLSEKRMEYAKQNIEFEFTVNPNDIFSLVYLNSVNLKRVLSNLINNAVNAILPKSGTVEVFLEANIAGSVITIKDNGRGMSSELLKEILTNAQLEKTKVNLGLPHAIKFLEQIDGQLDITSRLDEGTTLDISLPSCEIPAWCLKEYQAHNNAMLIIIDDSSAVHDVWDEMLKKLPQVKYQHFYSPEEALSFFEIVAGENLVIFCDYEFYDEDQNGLDILEQAPKDSEKVLVTSYLYNPTIMNSAIEKGFKILPKDLVPYFKLSNKEQHNSQKQISLIFIDDEPRNTQSWEFFAEVKNHKIVTYNDIQEFFMHAPQFAKNIPIYVDLDLRDEKNGIAYAKEIYELGFEKIYIATGAVGIALKKSEYPWITEIIEKKFPFI
ncbi:sensor histidine kinase [Legionella geestiana]|nr:HAMP domain-containing sensor histidine kinase [Legionella geestiana]QBS12842.1 HAMP domain-containing histidine kinase [Legionella geestiana]